MTIKIHPLKSPLTKDVHPETKLAIIGLTPGRQQQVAIETAKRGRQGAFLGQMRRNLFRTFGELGINDYLGVVECDDLFELPEFERSVFITSLLANPVFVEKEGVLKNDGGLVPVFPDSIRF